MKMWWCVACVVMVNGILTVKVCVMVATRGLSAVESDTHNTSLVESQVSQLSLPSDKYRKEIEAIYQEEGNLKKPAAHCVIHPAFRSDDDLAVMRWSCNDIMTYLGQNIHYNDGRLSVEKGGYYFVYSQILYQGNGTAELDYGRIIHEVLKLEHSKKDEPPTILMRNLQSTPTIRRGRLTYTTSSLGATFYLEPKSRVIVRSSIPDSISTVPCSTHFGLFMV